MTRCSVFSSSTATAFMAINYYGMLVLPRRLSQPYYSGALVHPENRLQRFGPVCHTSGMLRAGTLSRRYLCPVATGTPDFYRVKVVETSELEGSAVETNELTLERASSE
jgi:hypothetical protein